MNILFGALCLLAVSAWLNYACRQRSGLQLLLGLVCRAVLGIAAVIGIILFVDFAPERFAELLGMVGMVMVFSVLVAGLVLSAVARLLAGTMSPSTAKGVVRAAALLALIASIGTMVILLGIVIRASSSPDYFFAGLVGCCLAAVIPGMTLWESIGAWRLRPRSIESIASMFMFVGLSGLVWSIAEIACKVHAPFPKPLAAGVVSLVMAVIGYIVGRLQVRFQS